MQARDFERDVASVYRALGAEVQHDIVLAGSQIDILVRERTASGTEVRIAVETKAYSKPVGIDVTAAFASLAAFLKQRGLIDRAVIVATSGFTNRAREAATQYGIELLEYADLRQRLAGRDTDFQQARQALLADDASRFASPDAGPKRIFVLMPFADGFTDVYVLGIREVAERLGYVVERADDIEHNTDVLEVIKQKIRVADAVVGDTTGSNPNVYYEIGFSHAANRPTILITRRGSTIPFDLRGVNHIMYTSIVDLRERLERRVRATLGE